MGSPAVSAAANAPTTSSGATYPFNPSHPVKLVHSETNPLPRGPGSFDSLFGPGTPLYPDALDPLGPSGRAGMRRTEYKPGYNIQLIDREVPWKLLEQLATQCDLVNRCIELIQDSVVGMEWSWSFSKQIINQIRVETGEPNSAKATKLARNTYGDELDHVQKFFERPDRLMGFTFSQWLTALIWTHLVYDGIAIVPRFKAGGDLHSLTQIDTSTIKIYRDNRSEEHTSE